MGCCDENIRGRSLTKRGCAKLRQRRAQWLSPCASTPPIRQGPQYGLQRLPPPPPPQESCLPHWSPPPPPPPPLLKPVQDEQDHLPFWSSHCFSNSTLSPSSRYAVRSSPLHLRCTNTSSPPSSGVINPNPLSGKNFLTTPVSGIAALNDYTRNPAPG